MELSRTVPSRNEVIDMVGRNFYSARILNNAHRGDVAEMIVLSALGSEWRMVGLGWHPWDLQRGSGAERVRIQVRQLAALQLWGPTKPPLTLRFGWKKKAPDYFFRDNPGEQIEPEGWFCDLFVFGLHLEKDKERADQVDPRQWEFLVIPTSDLKPSQDSMALSEARKNKQWQSVTWFQLSEAMELAIKKMSRH